MNAAVRARGSAAARCAASATRARRARARRHRSVPRQSYLILSTLSTQRLHSGYPDIVAVTQRLPRYRRSVSRLTGEVMRAAAHLGLLPRKKTAMSVKVGSFPLKLHAELDMLEIISLFKTAKAAACRQNTEHDAANRERGRPRFLRGCLKQGTHEATPSLPRATLLRQPSRSECTEIEASKGRGRGRRRRRGQGPG